jgi:hypothetical protein
MRRRAASRLPPLAPARLAMTAVFEALLGGDDVLAELREVVERPQTTLWLLDLPPTR